MVILIFLSILFPNEINQDLYSEIIFWNVGQGQWITVAQNSKCLHFDVGGEFINANKVSKTCKLRSNKIFYSHWDWDHIGLTKELKNFSDVCIAKFPYGETKKFKSKYLRQFPKCQIPNNVEELYFDFQMCKKENDKSQIFIWNKKLLVPGDSTKRMERIWSPLITNKKLKWFSVSHHGSRTSTSDEFLKHLTVNQAIVSARKKVYGHPHKIVVDRLKKHQVPLLKTEDWGNIRIILRP